MADMIEVIDALERCKPYCMCDDEGCPYYPTVGCIEVVRKDALELLKEQQQKKIELLGKFDKEIEEAREAVEDCACDGDHSGVVYFQHKQHDFQYAKAIIENVL